MAYIRREAADALLDEWASQRKLIAWLEGEVARLEAELTRVNEGGRPSPRRRRPASRTPRSEPSSPDASE